MKNLLLLDFFRQGMIYQQDWANYQVGEVEEITEMDFNKYYETIKQEGWIAFLMPIIEEYKDGSDEPLDGDEVDRLCEIIKAEINLHEGNITEEEYENKWLELYHYRSGGKMPSHFNHNKTIKDFTEKAIDAVKAIHERNPEGFFEVLNRQETLND